MMSMYRIHEMRCRICLITALKKTSEVRRNVRGANLRYFVNLNVLVGYKQQRNDPSVVQEVKKWLYDDVLNTIDGDEAAFNSMFKDKLDNVFTQSWAPQQNRPTLSEFMSRKTWNAGKAATTRSLTVYSRLKGLRKTKKTKSNSSYELSDCEVKKLMLDTAPQRMTLVQKQDIGRKLRNVVCGEMQNYLRMCF